MEPMNDDELSRVLRQWEAPSAPPHLEREILARARARPSLARWLGWLLTGTVRIPVPVGLCLLAALFILAFRVSRPSVSDLSDFQQVKEFKPRIVSTSHEP